MRGTLLILGLAVASLPAAAQSPTPAPAASGVRPDSVSGGVRDSLLQPAPNARSARFAFPTEGGVFYYRAGSGSGVQRVRRADMSPTLETGLTVSAGSSRIDATGNAITEGISPTASRTPEAGPTSAASGVTQRDLDQLEQRMARALDRRLETMERERLGVRDPSRDPERTTGAVIVAPQQPSTTVSPRGMEPSDRSRVVEGSPAATPEAPPAAPTAEQVERDILDTGLFRTTFVNFEFARASLLPLSEQTLDAVVTVLVRYPTLQIQIGGHTDNVGTDQTNDALSQARAESVTDYLVARGVARGRLSSVGYGERDPVASNENETGRALNRRVEFVVLDSGESIQR